MLARIGVAVILGGIGMAGEWPQFLGPQRNGASLESAAPGTLAKARLLWKKDVGAGFSAPVIASGKLILFQRSGNEEIVDCLNASTGDRVWRFSYGTSYRDDFGFDEGPRGTPTVVGGKVYTFGAEGVLHAIDFAT